VASVMIRSGPCAPVCIGQSGRGQGLAEPVDKPRGENARTEPTTVLHVTVGAGITRPATPLN
jgi:hypothetical protein